MVGRRKVEKIEPESQQPKKLGGIGQEKQRQEINRTTEYKTTGK